MENIQGLSDTQIVIIIGKKLREWRLEADMSQAELANKAALSLYTVRSIEGGKKVTFSSFLKILRILGRLDSLAVFAEERHLSPIEYQKLEAGLKEKKRASKKTKNYVKDTDSKPIW